MSITATPLKGLQIKRTRFDSVQEGREFVRGTGPSGVVSAEVLEATLERRPTCKCSDPVHMAGRGFKPLRAGLRVAELVDLEEGCTRGTPTPGICTRLDNVRRRYGK